MTKIILDRLCNYLKIKNYRDLAKYLGIPPTRVYSWTKYGKITDVGIILVKNPELNPGWLYTGTGEMLVDDQRVDQAVKDDKVVMTIEPGPSRKDHISGKTTETPLEEQSDSLTEDEAIEQTRYVLRSNTVYRGALVSNIRAFYQGVKREEEMLDVDMTMMSMQEQLDRQEKTMNRMEKLLEKFLGEGTTKEKIQVGGEK